MVTGKSNVGLTCGPVCKEKHVVGPLLMLGTWRTE